MQKPYIFSQILDVSPIGYQIRKIIDSYLSVVDPYNAVRNVMRYEGNVLFVGEQQFLLPKNGNIYLIGVGKASQKMALAVKHVLFEKIHSGLLITKEINDQIALNLLPNVYCLKGNHPVPGYESISNTANLIAFLQNITKDDLVLCVISGGGSALLSAPKDGISLKDMQKMTDLLLKCGAEIKEINIIRKKIDGAKGGGIARMIYPARLISLILSDVVGDPLDMIASGPTIHDETAYMDAWRVLEKYRLLKIIPNSIRLFLKKGISGQVEERLSKSQVLFSKTHNFLVANNTLGCEAAKITAEDLGFTAYILSSRMRGEAKYIGSVCAGLIKQITRKNVAIKKPICLILGGETTVKVIGRGKGGRNQELALSAAIAIDGIPNVCCVAFASDGEDGPTDAAGAIVDGNTINKGKAMGLSAPDFLLENNSHKFLDAVGSLIRTGSTGTNVNDVVLLFAF